MLAICTRLANRDGPHIDRLGTGGVDDDEGHGEYGADSGTRIQTSFQAFVEEFVSLTALPQAVFGGTRQESGGYVAVFDIRCVRAIFARSLACRLLSLCTRSISTEALDEHGTRAPQCDIRRSIRRC